MYGLIKTISVIIRQFLVPNPFEPRADALLLNLIAEPFLHIITYNIVGIFYESRSAPALGSFLYLLFYFVHTGLLILMGFFSWNKIAIMIIVVSYMIVLGLIKSMTNLF